jgi:hypothetical protein
MDTQVWVWAAFLPAATFVFGVLLGAILLDREYKRRGATVPARTGDSRS